MTNVSSRHWYVFVRACFWELDDVRTVPVSIPSRVSGIESDLGLGFLGRGTISLFPHAFLGVECLSRDSPARSGLDSADQGPRSANEMQVGARRAATMTPFFFSSVRLRDSCLPDCLVSCHRRNRSSCSCLQGNSRRRNVNIANKINH